MTPEIRCIVLDTTGPAERLAVVTVPRAVALAFHGLLPAAGNEKPRQRVLTGSRPARFERL